MKTVWYDVTYKMNNEIITERMSSDAMVALVMMGIEIIDRKEI